MKRGKVKNVQENFPGVRVTKDFNDIIEDKTITYFELKKNYPIYLTKGALDCLTAI